jgi:hypothetical protein
VRDATRFTPRAFWNKRSPEPVTVPRSAACPQCGKPVEWNPENRFRPFCSERCKLIDLGAWASEAYRVPIAEDREDAEGSGSDADQS